MLTAVVICCIVVLLLASYAFYVEPRKIRFNVFNYQSPIKSGQKTSTTIRIGFVSDIHQNLKAAQKAAAWFRQQKVDYILLGGDYLTYGRPPKGMTIEQYITELLDSFTSFGKPVYAVLGNHDCLHSRGKGWARNPQWEELFKKSGATLLEDQAIHHGSLMIVGIRELCLNRSYDNRVNFQYPGKFAQVAQNYPLNLNSKLKNTTIVTLGHNPDVVWRLPDNWQALVLTGHTHGGQVAGLNWVPRFIWRLVNYKLNPHGSFGFFAGHRKIGSKHLFISRGIGRLPRFLRRPECHVVNVTL